MAALNHGPSNSAIREPEDVGNVKFEKKGRLSCHTFIGLPGCADGFVGVMEPFDPL